MRLAWAAFEHAPQGTEALIRFVRARVLPRLMQRVPIYRLTGKTAAGMSAVSIFAGHWDERDYLLSRFFAGPYERVQIDTVPISALPKVLRRLRSDAAITIARLPSSLVEPLCRSGCLCVPEAVDCEIAVSATPPALPLETKSAKHNAKVVRDNGFTWTASHDVLACNTFIATMYEPYLAARHGERAVRKAPSRVRRQFRRGALLLIQQQGAPVAGATVIVDGTVLRSGVLGMVEGSEGLLKRGVISALYLFGAEYARQRGLGQFNLGGSHPSLADGVLVHKCGWGARIVPRAESFRDYVLGWNEPNDAVIELLTRTPLIVRDGRGLSLLAAATSTTTATDLARLAKQASAAGLERVIALGERSRMPQGLWTAAGVAAERVREAAYRLEAQRC
jgi:hypothetical protein